MNTNIIHFPVIYRRESVRLSRLAKRRARLRKAKPCKVSMHGIGCIRMEGRNLSQKPFFYMDVNAEILQN